MTGRFERLRLDELGAHDASAADPLRAPGTDDVDEAVRGTGCVLVFLAYLVIVSFIVGLAVGRITA